MFTYVKESFTKGKVFILKALNIKNDFTASDAMELREKYKHINLEKTVRAAEKAERHANRVANNIKKDIEYMAKHSRTYYRLSKFDFRYSYNYFGDLLPIAVRLRNSGFSCDICEYETQEDELVIYF